MTDVNRFGGYDDGPVFAEYYDHTPPYNGRPDIDFYRDLSASVGGKILELGCGTGRILIPSAVAGCQIVGLENSEFMIARCGAKLENQPEDVQERVRLVRGNMIDFDLKETFNLITAPFRAFQYLISVEQQISCLHCVNRHLKAGGRFVFDVYQVDPSRIDDPAHTEEAEEFADVLLPDGRRFGRSHRTAAFHRAEQYNDVELIFYVTYPDGATKRLVLPFPFRYFFRYEVEHLLARTGFKVVRLFGNFDGSELTDHSDDMIFVAEKR